MSVESDDTGAAEWPKDVAPETEEFFDRTIAAWYCDACATEFTIDSVLASMRGAGLECPVCGTGAVALLRRGDHPERTEGDR